MERLLLIIADPDAADLDDKRVRAVAQATGAGSPHWLAPGIAAEAPLPAALPGDDAVSKARAAIGEAFDFAVVPAEGRAKKLLIADMDSTIIEQECIDELADFAGKRDEISAITERAMRGELDFEAALTERVAMLKGLSEDVVEACFKERISLTPGAEALTGAMRRTGAVCALVSGGFTVFTSRVAEKAGFDRQQANVLEIADGRLTGRVVPPILGREAKREALLSYCEELGISPAETIAVGDGANDLAMLGVAGLGVAFRAKPAVAAAAEVRIDRGDLTALLHLQGLTVTP